MSFIITGSQRSGTMSMASLFNIAHEKQFVPTTDYHNLGQILAKLRSESSWMAAPFVNRIQLRGIRVIHIIRHPLAVINSLMGIKFFYTMKELKNESDAEQIFQRHKPYRDFAVKFSQIPSMDSGGEQTIIKRCMFYWVSWIRYLVPCTTIKLEEIHNFHSLNSRQRWKPEGLNWSDIDDCPIKDKVMEIAEGYGYV